MKTLFYISPHLSKDNYGGSIVSRMNLNLIKKKKDLKVITANISKNPMESDFYISHTKNKFETFFFCFFLIYATLNIKGFFEILKIVKKIKPNYIWFDGSFFGLLCIFCKIISPKTKIISYFHNVESDILKGRVKESIINIVPWFNVWINEFLTRKIANVCVFIQQSDSERYPSSKNKILKVTMKDEFKNLPVSNVSGRDILFVGSDFPPNIEAIEWLNFNFHLFNNISITVVGRGMDKYKHRFNKLNIVGEVNDLSSFYANAYAVCAPIFSGGGMKVKICEALMFNKFVIATKFASIGYEESIGKAIILADDVTTFNKAVVEISSADISPRKYYLNFYSEEKGIDLINEIL